MIQLFVLDEVSEPLVRINAKDSEIEKLLPVFVQMINDYSHTEIRIVRGNATSCNRFIRQTTTVPLLREICLMLLRDLSEI